MHRRPSPEPGTRATLAVAAAVNDEAVLARNLLASPLLAEGAIPFHAERGAASAASAYNRAIDAALAQGADVLILAHQDVWFPPDWEPALRRTLARLDAEAPDWAVLGVFGTTPAGERVGVCWSSGLGKCVGTPTESPVPVQGLDELVLILRLSSGLRFDEGLPGWHLYGTDIVQTALVSGRSAWAATLPVVHNSRFVASLGGGFAEACRYMRAKWRERLPLRTPVVRLTDEEWPLWRLRFLFWRTRRRRRAAAADHRADPRRLAERCGFLSAEAFGGMDG